MMNICDSLDTIKFTEGNETEDSDGLFLPPYKREGITLNLVVCTDAAMSREENVSSYDNRVMAIIQLFGVP